MSRSINVRETIELLCKIFSDNGTSKIEAETLRKAKFDKTEACQPLWQLLFELASFCEYGKIASSTMAAFNKMSTGEQVVCVKKMMQRKGYLSRAFASLSSDMRRGSRELLLALAWLLHTEGIIHKFMENRSSPIDDDVMSLYESAEEEESRDHLHFPGKKYTPAQRVQQLLMLNHKLRMSLRLLHASQQEYATLTYKIHNATQGVSLSPGMNHLTTMQTHMLRHPQQMKKVLSLLEADSRRLENLLQWEDRELVFWEWMESVLDLKQHNTPDVADAAGSVGNSPGAAASTRTVYLDVPSTIGADIAASRRSLMNTILHYESAIEKLEELWESKRSTVSKLELDRLLVAINAEIMQVQSSLGRGPDSDPRCASQSPVFTLVKSQPGTRRPAKVSNALAASCQGGDAKKEEGVAIQLEIARLETEAENLEKELTVLRRECVQRLNAVTATMPDIVCILPPHLRQL